MRKGTDIIGLPVVDFATGDKFEKIQDVIFDPLAGKVVAFLTDEGGWFSSAKVLPLDRVRAIGHDAVLVDTKQNVVNAETIPNLKNVIEHGNVLKGRRIMTTEGEDLGSATDLFFEEKTGVVEGYEVSGGIFADAYTGRSFVPAAETLKLGQDVAFVTPHTSSLMEEQVGGIKAGLQTAGEKIQEAGAATGEKLQQVGQTAGEKLGDAKDKAGELADKAQTSVAGTVVGPDQQREYVLEKTVDRDVTTADGTVIAVQRQQVTPELAMQAEEAGVLPELYRATGGTLSEGLLARSTAMAAKPVVEEARGRRVRYTVRTFDGTIVAAEGQIVTDSVITSARASNKESALLDAVGLGTTNAAGGAARSMAGTAGEQARSMAGNAGEQARGVASEAGQAASDTWDRVREGLGSWQDRAAREREVQHINDALGRPVTRVILDQEDNVILNTGEIITHRAVDLARQAGALDILLDSIYMGEAPISPQQMVARESGEAALDGQNANPNMTPDTGQGRPPNPNMGMDENTGMGGPVQ